MASREQLTPRELAIMQVVWDRGEVTVRDVHEALNHERKVAYTTVMTLMGILTTKGHLTRRRNQRAYVYRPVRARQQVMRGLVRDFVDRVFDGAAGGLLLHLAKDRRLSKDERVAIKRMIEEVDE